MWMDVTELKRVYLIVAIVRSSVIPCIPYTKETIHLYRTLPDTFLSEASRHYDLKADYCAYDISNVSL